MSLIKEGKRFSMAKLHFMHAVMNAGKSTLLLQIRHNYASNVEVILLTSVIDSRNGFGKVSSRIEIGSDAIRVLLAA
jgi:thymidine kinase